MNNIYFKIFLNISSYFQVFELSFPSTQRPYLSFCLFLFYFQGSLRTQERVETKEKLENICNSFIGLKRLEVKGLCLF